MRVVMFYLQSHQTVLQQISSYLSSKQCENKKKKLERKSKNKGINQILVINKLN